MDALGADSERSTQRLIVVCGLGGAGKTTIANALSRHLNIACLHKDSIKAAISDGLGLLTPKSFMVFQTLIEEQLANGVDLIVEATFQFPDSADVLRHWQSTYGLDIVCVVCEADSAERVRRIKTRDRHEAHAEADAQQLAELDLDVDYSSVARQTHLDQHNRSAIRGHRRCIEAVGSSRRLTPIRGARVALNGPGDSASG